jgi:hypothetical protein
MNPYNQGRYNPGRAHHEHSMKQQRERSQDALRNMSRNSKKQRARGRAAEAQRITVQGSEAIPDQQRQMTVPPVAGWYADPWSQAPLRWWDGLQWTSHTGS